MIPTGDVEAVEAAALERLCRIGGREFLVEMIDLFLDNAPQRIRAARSANEEGDRQALYRAAHSLKSTAGNLGARAHQAAAERLEARAATADPAAMDPLLVEVEERYEAVRTRLEAERRRRTGS